MTTLATWVHGHLALVGAGLLAINTTFQKLPAAEKADLIDLVGRGLRLIWRQLTSRLGVPERRELTDEMKALIAEAVKAEMAKNGHGEAQN